MEGWDEVDEWDEEREATVSGGGRFDSTSVSFGSGDSFGYGARLFKGTVARGESSRGSRSGEEEGEGGVVVDDGSALRLMDRFGGC